MVGVIGIVCSLSAKATAQDDAAAAPADTIVWHARVYTENAKQPWAEGVAIRGASILAVGSNKDIEAFRGRSTRMIDAAGHLLLPRLRECHTHFMDASLRV